MPSLRGKKRDSEKKKINDHPPKKVKIEANDDPIEDVDPTSSNKNEHAKRMAKSSKTPIKQEVKVENSSPVKNMSAKSNESGSSLIQPKEKSNVPGTGHNRKIAQSSRLKQAKIDQSSTELGFSKEMAVKCSASLAEKSLKKIGAHVSAAGGIHKAIYGAIDIGCKSFALFLRNQRRWDLTPIAQDAVNEWNKAIQNTSFPKNLIIPHGSYLLNAGSSEPDKLAKTRETLIEECKRCETLGITYYNFHPGSTAGKCTREECIKRIAETINIVHQETKSVILVVETTAGGGGNIGGTFTELSEIIKLVEDKTRIGICIDTCHIFAAGYDIRTEKGYQQVMEDFDVTVGFPYLKAVHLNDSMGGLGSHRDRHANIGQGYLKYKSFKFLMKDPRFDNIPMILETPEGEYEKEIKKLYELQFEE